MFYPGKLVLERKLGGIGASQYFIGQIGKLPHEQSDFFNFGIRHLDNFYQAFDQGVTCLDRVCMRLIDPDTFVIVFGHVTTPGNPAGCCFGRWQTRRS